VSRAQRRVAHRRAPASVSFATAHVRQTRRLRDGRQLVEIDACPHCGASHWVMTDGTTLAHCIGEPNLPFFLDGLGDPVR
jgi:hypothetical protein